jgi:dihydroflavonol-4-reductase
MILVTGATGRIGNVLVKSLSKGKESVRVLVRKTSDLKPLKGLDVQKVYGDIREYEAVKNAVKGCQYVYHLAGHINISNKNKNLTFSTNIEGTKNILRACKELNVKKLLHTSSIHALESPKDGSIVNENTPLCDKNENRGVYDRSKAIATREVLNSNVNSVIVCPTGVTGPYDYRPSFFGRGMIQNIKAGLKTAIPGTYDYVDVRDVVKGMLSAMKKGKTKNIYILGGEQISIKEYTKLLQKFTGIKGKIKELSYSFTKTLGKILNFFSNNSSITPYSVDTLMSNSNISHKKAEKELGFKPRNIKQSLYDQFSWFKKNRYL